MARRSKNSFAAEAAQHTWKRRPSEIRGYQRAYYLTTDDGDYLRVDYNTRDKRVRLYVEVAGEGGSPYYSVISDGKITAEKSVQSGRNFGFAEKFERRADEFLTLPNREVIKLINGNYGISRRKSGRDGQTILKDQRLKQETRERYFRKDFYDEEGAGQAEAHRSFFGGRVRLVDILDILGGLILGGMLFYIYNYNYLVLGAIVSFYGIIIGLVDMLIRGRTPVFTKVLLFVVGGTVAWVYGYFF